MTQHNPTPQTLGIRQPNNYTTSMIKLELIGNGPDILHFTYTDKDSLHQAYLDTKAKAARLDEYLDINPMTVSDIPVGTGLQIIVISNYAKGAWLYRATASWDH